MTHDQTVAAAKQSASTTQVLAEGIRDALALGSHANANGMATALNTAATELAAFNAFMAGDKSGDLPAGTIVNPKAANNTPTVARRVEQKDENGNTVRDESGVVQYDIDYVHNPKYNASLPTHVFKSTTGLRVDVDGVLEESGEHISTLLLRLVLVGALDQFRLSEIDLGNDQTITVGNAIEQVVTV